MSSFSHDLCYWSCTYLSHISHVDLYSIFWRLFCDSVINYFVSSTVLNLAFPHLKICAYLYNLSLSLMYVYIKYERKQFVIFFLKQYQSVLFIFYYSTFYILWVLLMASKMDMLKKLGHKLTAGNLWIKVLSIHSCCEFKLSGNYHASLFCNEKFVVGNKYICILMIIDC